jgi:hypothetical protein
VTGPGRLPHREFPCASCPWRRDNLARYRYDNLADYCDGTIGTPGAEAQLGADMFACHASHHRERCAGWLAVAGEYHLTVRLAVNWNMLPATVLESGPGWPELFASAQEMLDAYAAAAALPPTVAVSASAGFGAGSDRSRQHEDRRDRAP